MKNTAAVVESALLGVLAAAVCATAARAQMARVPELSGSEAVSAAPAVLASPAFAAGVSAPSLFAAPALSAPALTPTAAAFTAAPAAAPAALAAAPSAAAADASAPGAPSAARAAAPADGPSPEAAEAVQRVKPVIDRIRAEFARVIVGQNEATDSLITGLIANEHVLFEGLPGTGKTMMMETFGTITGLDNKRIQGTPDLRPSDITGTEIVEEGADGRKVKRFERGPVFTNLLLFDEGNRAQPRTQSAVLAPMQERAVPIQGQKVALPKPFLVLMTQNPLEQEGTYPLPEAQLDRFMYKVDVPEPTSAERKIIGRRTSGKEIVSPARNVTNADEIAQMQEAARLVHASDAVQDYVNAILDQLKPQFSTIPAVKQQVRETMTTRAAGMILKAASVRALMDGRAEISFDDVQAVVPRVLRHRMILAYNAKQSADQLIDMALQTASSGKDGRSYTP